MEPVVAKVTNVYNAQIDLLSSEVSDESSWPCLASRSAAPFVQFVVIWTALKRAFVIFPRGVSESHAGGGFTIGDLLENFNTFASEQ